MSEREREGQVGKPASGRLPAIGSLRRGRRARDQHGLTLVELMVVVTIIAIIAVVAMALYQDIVKKSKLAADNGTVSSLRSAVAIYYGRTNGLFPPTLTAVENLVQPAPVFNCTLAPGYDKNNGKITFTAALSDCP